MKHGLSHARVSAFATQTMASARRHHQRGQSAVEFAVLAVFVTVPLMLIVPLLGKYLDIAQATAVASRYVAFEGEVRHSSSNDGWKSDVELAQEVRRRFFSNSDAPIKTYDVAGDFNAHRNTMWFDHRGKPLLPEFAKNVSATATRELMSQPFGAAYAGSFNLSHDNLYTGRVSVSIADIPGLKPFDTLGLSVSRTTTLLTDPWAAIGPGSVRSKIRGSATAFPYKALELAAMPLNPFISLLEPNSSPPDVGAVEPDKVPADRLGPAK